MTFDLIKQNYDRKLWSVDMVRMAVIRTENEKTVGIITEEQFHEITGQYY